MIKEWETRVGRKGENDIKCKKQKRRSLPFLGQRKRKTMNKQKRKTTTVEMNGGYPLWRACGSGSEWEVRGGGEGREGE